MKKVGSLKSRSKTPRISKNSAQASKANRKPSRVASEQEALPSGLGAASGLAVGHQPPTSLLAPQDEALFRAFQSNLLSLISHELRTPLTGILNALGALEDGSVEGSLNSSELVKMARQNAQRLHQALVALLDLASLESGTFHARLREVDLVRMIRLWIGTGESLFKDRGLRTEISYDASVAPVPVLADSQKLSRAVDLCFQMIAARAKVGSIVQVRISFNSVKLKCSLPPELFQSWKQAWSESLAGIAIGLTSPFSAFAGVLQSEQAFLVRSEEGLGSEFLLIHEIMRLHQGKLNCQFDESLLVEISLELPVLSTEDALRSVLTSRAYQVTTELGSVALVLVDVPAAVDSGQFREQIRKNLFRTTDAVYPLSHKNRVVLVLDDCKLEDAPVLIARLGGALGQSLIYSTAHCPTDGLDPGALLGIAEARLERLLEKG